MSAVNAGFVALPGQENIEISSRDADRDIGLVLAVQSAVAGGQILLDLSQPVFGAVADALAALEQDYDVRGGPVRLRALFLYRNGLPAPEDQHPAFKRIASVRQIAAAEKAAETLLEMRDQRKVSSDVG